MAGERCPQGNQRDGEDLRVIREIITTDADDYKNITHQETRTLTYGTGTEPNRTARQSHTIIIIG